MSSPIPSTGPRARRSTILPLAFALVLAGLYLYTATASGTGTIRVTAVEDGTSSATAVRVRVTDASGRPISKAPIGALAMPGEALGVPREALAIMWGHDDRAQGYATQPDGAFYVDGPFDLQLPPGEYRMTVTKGYEFARQVVALTVRAGQTRRERVTMRRWVDMPGRGWYSSDDHVHLRRSPRENPLVAGWMAAEDIHVGHLLQMGDFHTTYFTQYAFGETGRYVRGGRLLVSGQEDPRTPEIGHTISLGASELVRTRPIEAYYGYDRTFDRVHALGGITGYAHQAVTFHGYRGLVLDVLQQKLDFLELMQFCAPGGPLITTHYYLALDLGYPLTALAGSDFPWCGRTKAFGASEDEGPRIGDARFYTQVEGPLTFERWMAGVKAGRTFVTTGPMLELLVDDAGPGATLDRRAGDTVRIVARAHGHATDVPLRDLEVVVHGNAVAATTSETSGQSVQRLEVSHSLTLGAHGVWIAVRARGGPTQAAHTTPVYVRVDGVGFRNPATHAAHLDSSERYLQEIEQTLASPGTAVNEQLSRGRAAMEQRLAAARAILARLRASSPTR